MKKIGRRNFGQTKEEEADGQKEEDEEEDASMGRQKVGSDSCFVNCFSLCVLILCDCVHSQTYSL